jgi:hypothetical protein
LAEARALIVSQTAHNGPAYTAHHRSDRSSNDCAANRPGGGSCRRASGLSLRREWENEERHGCSRR